jgi:hypothetical protein
MSSDTVCERIEKIYAFTDNIDRLYLIPPAPKESGIWTVS